MNLPGTTIYAIQGNSPTKASDPPIILVIGLMGPQDGGFGNKPAFLCPFIPEETGISKLFTVSRPLNEKNGENTGNLYIQILFENLN